MQDVLMEALRPIAQRLGVSVLVVHTPADVLAGIHVALDKVNARAEAVLQARDMLGLAAQMSFFGDEKGHRAALAKVHQILSADAS